MKKQTVYLYGLICVFSIACRHIDDNMNFRYSNSDRYYSMNAEFSKARMNAVERYLDRSFGKQTNTPLIGTTTDGTISLDDHTIFYLKKSPGKVNIKMNKHNNSPEAYLRIKAMCEGIEDVVINPG